MYLYLSKPLFSMSWCGRIFPCCCKNFGEPETCAQYLGDAGPAIRTLEFQSVWLKVGAMHKDCGGARKRKHILTRSNQSGRGTWWSLVNNDDEHVASDVAAVAGRLDARAEAPGVPASSVLTQCAPQRRPGIVRAQLLSRRRTALIPRCSSAHHFADVYAHPAAVAYAAAHPRRTIPK